MDRMNLGDGKYASKRKRTRRETFLAEMEQVIPWTILLNLIEPFYPKAGNSRPPYPLKVMLKVHLMQNWLRPSPSNRDRSAAPSALCRRVQGSWTIRRSSQRLRSSAKPMPTCTARPEISSLTPLRCPPEAKHTG